MIDAICGYFALPKGEDWENLTKAQIAAHCHARAETAIAFAEDAPEASVPLLETAEAWMQLADDIASAEKTAPAHARYTPRFQLGNVREP